MVTLRSLLYVPGSSDKMIAKSLNVEADAVIYDLEDGVSPDEKAAARERVVTALRSRLAGRADGPELWVRINGIGDPNEPADVAAMVAVRPDAIMLPKADAASVAMLESQLNDLEPDSCDPTPMAALIETCRGLLDVEAVCRSSRRLIAIQLGAEDLTREIGVPRTAAGDEIQYARSHLVVVGHAYAKQVLDTPNTAVHDSAVLAADAARARALGMTGKTCIHPDQIKTVNRAFAPSDEAIAQAWRIVAAFDDAMANGRGAIAVDGRMVDAPVAERARKLLGHTNIRAARAAADRPNERK